MSDGVIKRANRAKKKAWRATQPKQLIPKFSAISLIKDIYFFSGLPEPLYKKYWLIEAYQEKVSTRLLEEKARLRAEAERLSGNLIRDMVYSKSPVFDLIKPDNLGKYVPVPIKIDD